MLALLIQPQRSRYYALLIVALHLGAALAFIVWLHGSLLWLALFANLGAWIWASWQWWHSAAYRVDIHPNNRINLAWRGQAAISVRVRAVPLLSRCVSVVLWQDGQDRIYRTLLWQDSVAALDYKQWYVWLRWQPQPQHDGNRNGKS